MQLKSVNPTQAATGTLTFTQVTKFYGPVIGLNDVSCQLGPGITGLLGGKSAGKSTLIKLASGQLRPTSGTVRVGDDDAWSAKAKRHLGYSPDVHSFYEDMTGRQFVMAMARMHGFPKTEAARRTDEAIAAVGMSDRAERRLGGGSHGMRQRIKLAQALVHDPWLLLLDEPLAGIDPLGRHDLGELLLGLAARGKTILLSTHVLAEVEQLASSILIVARGRIVASGSLAEARALVQGQSQVVEIVSDQPRLLSSLLAARADVASVEVRGETLLVRTSRRPEFFADLGRLVCEHKIDVRRMQSLDGGVEAVFDYFERGRT